MLKYWCNEKLTPHHGSSDGYHFASDFMPGRCQRHHSHGDGWQWRVRLYAFICDDSSRRHGAVDLELVRTQQYLGFARDAYRLVGLWDSQPGSFLHAHVQHRRVVLVLLHSARGMLRYERHDYGCE